jgi:hypothetical protein
LRNLIDLEVIRSIVREQLEMLDSTALRHIRQHAEMAE